MTIPRTNRAYHNCLQNSNEKSIFMHPDGPLKIENVMIKPNSIPPVILRNFKKEKFLSHFVSYLTYHFQKESFSDPLKCSNVILIYINIRPIKL